MSLLANFGGIEGISSELNTKQQKIEETLSQLETQLNGIYQGWDGAAQQAYHTSQTEWHQSAGERRTQLNIMSQLAQTSGQAYQSADQSAANRT